MDTQENANFARIACLTMQEGTDRIRNKILKNIDGSQSFRETLRSKEQVFKNLRKKRVLSKSQYDILYPSHDLVHLSNIDMTLWVILARNLTKGRQHVRWNEYPDDRNITWQHDVIRLKEIRNKLFHLKAPELTVTDFQTFRDDVVCALRRLGSLEEVLHDHLSRDLDPEKTKMCCMQVREQCLEELHQIWEASIYGKKQMKNENLE